jgi:ferredoxin
VTAELVITRANVDELLGELLTEGRRLVAPVREGERVVFQEVASPAEIDFPEVNTTLPPKETLFPRTEPILDFATVSGALELKGASPEIPETVLYGVRPCDAAGLDLLTTVFSDEPKDLFFVERRAHTVVISVACTTPGPVCFCTAVGFGPASERGSDLLLVELGSDRYLSRVASEAGRELVEHHRHLFIEDETVSYPRLADELAARVERTESLVDAGPRLREAFDDESWDRVALACLGCGICAFTCPSCHCFDLIEEGTPDRGSRLKVWDCCAFSSFTVHASGHNPRPDQAARYRQRLLHKLTYFPERYGDSMCVGCGRCIVHCPVGQDIYEAALTVLRSADGQAAEPRG